MERLTEKITNIKTGKILAYRLKSSGDRIKADNKLGQYEDAEERGLLKKLICNVGDTVYYLDESLPNPVVVKISKIEICEDGCLYIDDEYNTWEARHFGEIVFLVEEKARQKLKELKQEVK